MLYSTMGADVQNGFVAPSSFVPSQKGAWRKPHLTSPHLTFRLSVYNNLCAPDYNDQFRLSTAIEHVMAPFKQPQRRRKSSEAATSHGARSRAVSRPTSTQSNLPTGSRYSANSRRSSAESLQGQGRRKAPLRRPSTRSGRPISVATSRTFGGDERSTVATEAPPDDFEADIDMQNEVVMAVNLSDRGTVGCVYYVARDEKLYFMEDVRMGGADVIDARKCVHH